MVEPGVIDELTSDFVAETREMLEHVSDTLVAWEANPADGARLDEVFRFVHTVKGSCGFLDLPRIGTLAHAAESALAGLRDGTRIASDTTVGTLLAIIDRIALLTAALETPGASLPPEESDRALLDGLDRRTAADPLVTAPHRQRDSTVRITIPLLEAMMGEVSELVLVRNELALRLNGIDDRDLTNSFNRLSAIVGELRESVTRARMQPIERLFATLPRLVRDTAKECGKNVRLEISGEGVEIDREMVEAIRDPLIHIVRNAIDHGIEPSEDRVQLGKSATSTLRVSALQSGNQVSIEISDDGRGIDTDKLVRRALTAGLIDKASAEAIDPANAAMLVFHAGLSTTDAVSQISGRGVGMDVVRANVERLGGRVTLNNVPGRGLSVTLKAPLTLSIVNVLVVKTGGSLFALPQGAIDEVLSLRQADVRLEPMGGGLIAVVRGVIHPAFALSAVLGLEAGQPELIVMLSTPSGARLALAVEDVLDHEELVARPMAPGIAAAGLFAGQSLGHDGQPIIILDAAGIAASQGMARTDDRAAPVGPNGHDELVSLKRHPSVLIATSLDGETIAVRATAIERLIDTVHADWSEIGRGRYLRADGSHLTAVPGGELPKGQVPVLLLARGDARLALPLREVRDLVAMERVTQVDIDGVEGLIHLGHETAALLDVDALFGQPHVDRSFGKPAGLPLRAQSIAA